MPNAATLASEYVPKHRRAFAVTMTIVCFPLGGTLAALISGHVVPQYGWRAVYILGGTIPIVLGFVMAKLLPESPRFLAGHPERWPELITLLRRMGHEISPDASFIERGTSTKLRTRTPLRELFVASLRWDTTGLCIACFFCLMANNIGFAWIVSVLSSAGFALPAAANGLAAFNFGGVGGAILAALIIQQLGSRVTMLGMAAVAGVSAVGLAAMPLDAGSVFKVTAMLGLIGGLMNAIQTTMYALAANVYPTDIRGAGVGLAVAVGRIGQVLASYAGSSALEFGGPPAYFASWAVAMGIVFAALAIVQRHIEPVRAAQTVPKVLLRQVRE
jgi:AAHS family 4-hydroxybenzoate transporter-like MFS transporter